MYKIQTLNAISDVIYTQLSADKYTVSKDEPVPDAILVRSAAMHDMEFNKELLAIGRAGAGVNNIPIDRCSKEGIRRRAGLGEDPEGQGRRSGQAGGKRKEPVRGR